MSPIIDLQRRLHEDGRIRIGHQVESSNGKMRPAKLERLRFTSQSERAIRAIAHRYGGEAQLWEGAPVGVQYEVFTEAIEIPVVVPPERMSFSQWYETWTAGGCKHRCDGEVDTITDGPCPCDPDDRVCKPHTRLSVMLADYPGTGLWRIETGGHYAKNELAGAFELAQLLVQATGRSVLAARLRLEQRQVKRPDPKDADKVVTRNFPVVVLDFDANLAQIALGAGEPVSIGAGRPELSAGGDDPDPSPPAGLTPVPREPAESAPSVVEQITQIGDAPTGKRRANAAPTLPATGLAPRTAIEAESADVAPPAPPAAKAAEPVKTQGRQRRAAAPKPAETTQATATKPEGGLKSEYLPNGELRITPAMIRSVFRLFALAKVSEKPERLTYYSNIAHREIETTTDLSVPEASRLIDSLKELVGEEPPPREGDAA